MSVNETGFENPRPSRELDDASARRPGRHSAALRALTSGALALPGLAGSASADGPVTKASGDYNFSYYSEDNLNSGDVVVGSNERYEIEIHQVHIEAPVNDQTDVTVDVLYESMSGATPWFVVPDGDDDVAQAMTGATIEDTRTDVNLGANFYRDWGKSGITAGLSMEDDYLAFSGGASGERHFNDKHTTLSTGFGFSVDEIDPVDSEGDLFRIQGKDYKHSYSLFGGISQVVNRASVIQSSISYQHSRGFLSDPYKLVAVQPTDLRADDRPDKKDMISWLTRYRRHSERFNGTIHLDYRLYWDSWDVTSHTVELAWYQSLFTYFKLIPAVRYYSQSEADFYAPFFETVPSDGHMSSDYRLSNYGALGFRIRAEVDIPWKRYDISGFLGYERYMSDESMAIQSGNFDESPGLLSFNLFSVGLKAKF